MAYGHVTSINQFDWSKPDILGAAFSRIAPEIGHVTSINQLDWLIHNLARENRGNCPQIYGNCPRKSKVKGLGAGRVIRFLNYDMIYLNCICSQKGQIRFPYIIQLLIPLWTMASSCGAQAAGISLMQEIAKKTVGKLNYRVIDVNSCIAFRTLCIRYYYETIYVKISKCNS